MKSTLKNTAHYAIVRAISTGKERLTDIWKRLTERAKKSNIAEIASELTSGDSASVRRLKDIKVVPRIAVNIE